MGVQGQFLVFLANFRRYSKERRIFENLRGPLSHESTIACELGKWAETARQLRR